jgi:hypothetical protein
MKQRSTSLSRAPLTKAQLADFILIPAPPEPRPTRRSP